MTSTPVDPNTIYVDMPTFHLEVEPSAGTVPVDAVITVVFDFVPIPDVGVS